MVALAQVFERTEDRHLRLWAVDSRRRLGVKLATEEVEFLLRALHAEDRLLRWGAQAVLEALDLRVVETGGRWGVRRG